MYLLRELGDYPLDRVIPFDQRLDHRGSASHRIWHCWVQVFDFRLKSSVVQPVTKMHWRLSNESGSARKPNALSEGRQQDVDVALGIVRTLGEPHIQASRSQRPFQNRLEQRVRRDFNYNRVLRCARYDLLSVGNAIKKKKFSKHVQQIK